VRVALRGIVFLVIFAGIAIVKWLTVFQARRMVTFSLIFYCCVGIIMIDEQKCPILFSGPGYLEWIPCDYNECIAATTLACVQNSLPYVVAQACVASTIFRLPLFM